jgi:hypothetical protein
MPTELIVATAALLVLQVPPATASAKVVVLPWQMVVVPVMVPADGAVFTVTPIVATPVPQLLVTE